MERWSSRTPANWRSTCPPQKPAYACWTGWVTRTVNLSDLTYTGWELWQYGCRVTPSLEIAQAWTREVERIQPGVVVTLAPSSAYLLRHVFPQELGAGPLAIPVLTLPEAVLARIGSLSPRPAIRIKPVFLVPSHTELIPTAQHRSARSPGAVRLFHGCNR